MAAILNEHKVEVAAADGGIQVLRQLFRIPAPNAQSPPPSPSLLDAILVSFDLETSGRTSKGQRDITKVNKKEVSGVREAGLAILDTRSLFPPFSFTQQRPQQRITPPLISTKQFSTLYSSEDYEDCDVTNFRECAFAKTDHVEREKLADKTTSCLQFPGETPEVRAIVIVGQSPQRDLEIVRKLGVELARVSPIAAVLDTHKLCKSILGPNSPLVITGQRPALEKHALSDILTELGVPYNERDLHNAGNDATYTLHALILLAVRYANCMMAEEKPSPEQLEHTERLRAFARVEFEAPRWKPVRRALGAHSREKGAQSTRKLGSGLELLISALSA